MFVGQSGTTDRLVSIGCTMFVLNFAGTWLANDMLPCRYLTPRSLAAFSMFGLDPFSPWPTGTPVSSFGLVVYTPRPEYSGVFSTLSGMDTPIALAAARLLLISAAVVL